jgi:hypothetical protein
VDRHCCSKQALAAKLLQDTASRNRQALARRKEDSQLVAAATDAYKNDPQWDIPRPSRASSLSSAPVAAALGDASSSSCGAVWEGESYCCGVAAQEEQDMAIRQQC